MTTRFYRRAPADARSDLIAAVAGAAAGTAVGLTAWYFARTWLRRERVDAEAHETDAPATEAVGTPGRGENDRPED